MKLETPIMAALISVLFLIGGTMIINEHIVNYDINVTNKVFQNISAQYNETYAISSLMKEKTEPGEVSSGLGALDQLISGIFNVVQYIWQSISITKALVTEIGLEIGMPAFIIDIFFAMIGVALIFSIVYLIFRYKPK